ncbi:MAG: hypothetical protein R2867_01720 [Caldilineaceae bacterium]
MLNHIDIQQLVDYENHECPVVSVYLDVDPRRRSVEQYRLALRNLLDTVEKANAKDIEKIQNYVEMGYNRQGCGLIMFSCEADGFWWAQSVQPPVEDRVFVSFRPYIRPLAVLLDTYDRYGVIHVDQAGARLYLFHMGILEAAEGHLWRSCENPPCRRLVGTRCSGVKRNRRVRTCRKPPSWPSPSIVKRRPVVCY